MDAGKVRLSVRELLLIVATLVAVGWNLAPKIWGAATWKDGVDNSLQQIDRHLTEEDKKLEWLIQHNPQAAQAPMDFLHPKVSQNMPWDITMNRKIEQPLMATE